MALNRRSIKLGRLFMVAWLAFFIYPVAALITTRFEPQTRVVGLALLLVLALIWGWFWLRIVGGPDSRFAIAAVVAVTLVLVVFTLRTPPQYGSLFLYAVIMAGAAFKWRIGLVAVIFLSLLSGAVELARGESVTNSTGQFLNELLVGLTAVAGRLLIEANQQLSLARERVVDPGLAAAALSTGISPLSEREREVLVAGRNGAGIAEIAKALFLSEGTVRNYLSSAIQKLEVSNRTEAARVPEDQGWL